MPNQQVRGQNSAGFDMQYVYIMKGGATYYKIGIANNPHKRAREIQTANGEKVYIVAAHLYDDAAAVERSMHQKFKEYRSPGGKEWFLFTPELALKACICLHTQPFVSLAGQLKFFGEIQKQKELLEELAEPLNDLISRTEHILAAKPPKPSKIIKRVKPTAIRLVPLSPSPEEELRKQAVAEEERRYRQEEKQREEFRLLTEAILHGLKNNKMSTSFLQRHMRIGYGKAANLIDEMEKQGIVAKADGNKPRFIHKTKAKEVLAQLEEVTSNSILPADQSMKN